MLEKGPVPVDVQVVEHGHASNQSTNVVPETNGVVEAERRCWKGSGGLDELLGNVKTLIPRDLQLGSSPRNIQVLDPKAAINSLHPRNTIGIKAKKALGSPVDVPK